MTRPLGQRGGVPTAVITVQRTLFGGRRGLTTVEGELPFLGNKRVAIWTVLACLVAAGAGAATGQYGQTVVGVGCAYLIAAVGYNLVLGVAGQFAFCQGGFMAIGAYLYGVYAGPLGELGALLLALAVGALAGILIGAAAIRTRGIYLALVTLAFAEAVVLIVEIWPATQGDNGLSVELWGSNAYLLGCILAGIALLLCDRVMRSRLGRGFQMIKENESLATAMGVQVRLCRVTAFGLSGLLGAAGGVILAATLTFITPENFSLTLTLSLLAMIVVGGIGTLWGSLVGVALLTAVAQLIPGAAGLGDYLYGGVLFVVLAVMPGGLTSLVSKLEQRGS